MNLLTKARERVKKAREDWHQTQIEQEKKEIKRLEGKLAKALAKEERKLDIEEQKERQVQLKKEIRYAKGITLPKRPKKAKKVKATKPKAQIVYVTTQPVRSKVKRKTTAKRKKSGRRTRTTRKALRGATEFIGKFGYSD